MPLSVACARYSLVKGERIVRFALTTRLLRKHSFSLDFILQEWDFSGNDYGTKLQAHGTQEELLDRRLRLPLSLSVSHTYTLLYLDDFSPLDEYQEYQGLD